MWMYNQRLNDVSVENGDKTYTQFENVSEVSKIYN
jgi:hypothetical protein